jgi:hypothetical protein
MGEHGGATIGDLPPQRAFFILWRRIYGGGTLILARLVVRQPSGAVGRAVERFRPGLVMGDGQWRGGGADLFLGTCLVQLP